MNWTRARAVLGAAWVAGVVVAATPGVRAGEAAGGEAFALRLPRDVQVFAWKVDFSGEVRLRAERWHNVDMDRHADDSDGRFLLRSRVRADIVFGEAMRAVVEVLDARELDSDRGQRRQIDEVDLRQAYVQFDGLLGAPLMLRVGRQELKFGSTRLVSAPTWSNFLRSFDAVRLTYHSDAVEVHGFLGSVVVNEDDHSNEHRHGDAFFGVFSTLRLCPGHKLDLYTLNLLSRKQEVVGEDGVGGDHELYTVGTRLFGSLDERWTYDVELAHQRGRYSHDDIRAWAFHADTAYTLDLPWQPTIQPLFNWATGDKDPDDGRRNTFAPLFPCGHWPYGVIDFFHWMNVREIGCRFKVKPVKKLMAIAEVHRYWLDEDKDAWYTCSRRPKRRDATGQSDRSVGHELSLVLKYRVHKQLTLEGGWAHFFAGPFVRDTGPADDADFVYFQTLVRF